MISLGGVVSLILSVLSNTIHCALYDLKGAISYFSSILAFPDIQCYCSSRLQKQ